MATRERHPTDRKSITYGISFLISSAFYTVIVAAWSYFLLTQFPDSGVRVPSFVSLCGTWGMLLCGIAYVLFGRSKRLRIRHPMLIAIHFFGSNAALITLVYLEMMGVSGNSKPPTVVETISIMLYYMVGGIFVVNLWRSLQSNPAQRQPTA